MPNNHEKLLQILPIADTIGGTDARENPKKAIDHYSHLARQLWLSPEVSRLVAESAFSDRHQGRTTWGSLSGPYGFGKTAAAIALWEKAKNDGFLAIPPLSCTNFNELAHGVAALAGEQEPKFKKRIRELFQEVFTKGLNPIVQTDAKRYSVSTRTVRRMYQDKLAAGQFALDSHPHRTVEFFARLGQLAMGFSKGLVIILDELQQLLGPLDARAIVQFREFVWAMRTEVSHCGVILALDSFLEARLARWATDILHRIRENGPTVKLTEIYTREFPSWLWDKVVSCNGKDESTFKPDALSKDVLVSLGQLVERPDLANGPRTVVDVFSRAGIHYQETGENYDIAHFIDDVHQGRFRYFGEGATIQSVLTRILSDEWITSDEGRKKLVETLAVFPQGCSQQTLAQHIPDEKQLEKASGELFAPLLVELSEGLALESLQQVRRTYPHWEQVLSRCWETIPALDALAAKAPSLVHRVLAKRLFREGILASPKWEWLSDESSAVLTGWHRLRGTFNDDYPQRDVALCITNDEPNSWPQDVDVCIALVCDASPDADVGPTVEFLEKSESSLILLRLSLLRSLVDRIPAALQRYRKYLQPEPFRPITILSALHDLEAFLGDLVENANDVDTHASPEEQAEIKRLAAFVEAVVDFVLRELIVGKVEVGKGMSISLRGPELLHALFTRACRHRFPDYQTLARTIKWHDILSTYRKGIRSDRLNAAQRQGREKIVMPKAEMYQALFNQSSTAAGDSFIKKLGPLVEPKGDSKSFSLRLTMHPAENALIGYAKGIYQHQSVPFDAAVEFLQPHGYLRTETEEIVEILVARECLTKDSNGDLRFIADAERERARLQEKIAEMHRSLCHLEEPDIHASISPEASIVQLQEHLNLLEVRLRERVEAQITALANGVKSLEDLVGTVKAVNIPAAWSVSKLSTALTGLANKLRDTRGTILKALRKELRKASDVQSSAAGVEWAISWQSERKSFSQTLQKSQERVVEFKKRGESLSSWEALNSKLCSTVDLCALIRDRNHGTSLELDRLVREFQARFATDTWSPLDTADEFSERLGKVQSDIQQCLYSYVQTFNKELAEIRSQFGVLLPATPPPMFDVSANGDGQEGSIRESFQELYQWAYDGFRVALKDYQRRKNGGAQWRKPNNERAGWKSLETQIEAELWKSEGSLNFNMVQRIGTKVLSMQRGFAVVGDIEAICRSYANPDEPPDFQKIEQLFLEGKIQIQIDPQNPISANSGKREE